MPLTKANRADLWEIYRTTELARLQHGEQALRELFDRALGPRPQFLAWLRSLAGDLRTRRQEEHDQADADVTKRKADLQRDLGTLDALLVELDRG